jgi:hypothetical protein
VTAITLICFRADKDDLSIRTYAAVRSSEAGALLADAISDLGDAETLPWETLPGVKRLAAAEVGARPPRSVAILGTTEGRAWATWHLPVEPPPVPA